MLKFIARLLNLTKQTHSPTRVLCVHGKAAFQRNIIAAQLFLEQLSLKDTGAIICSSSAIVPILERLGVDVEDNVRWWTTAKKLEYAEHVLADIHPNIKMSLTPITADVVWVDRARRGYERVGDEMIIFSGRVAEEPFIGERRISYVCGKTGARSGATLPGQSCSGWMV